MKASISSCSVVLKPSELSIRVCEIREPDQDWEGIGKSSTYLDLLGIEPSLLGGASRLPPCDSPEELSDALTLQGNLVGWSDLGVNRIQCELFAADFVWLWQDSGKLCVSRPLGEQGWGMWDSSRQMLRTSLKELPKGFQRTEIGHRIQTEIFHRLPFSKLASLYNKSETVAPAMIIVLRPNGGALQVRETKDSEAHALLTSAIHSAPYHHAAFWQGSTKDIERHKRTSARILAQVCKVPPTFEVTGTFPFGSIAKTIEETILPSFYNRSENVRRGRN